MSTHAVIARVTDVEGGFKGVYHHWDGYPKFLGAKLWSLLKGPYSDNLPRLLHYVIDQHSAGWSTLDCSKTKQPECYCHPRQRRKREGGNLYTNKDVGGIEWLYIFDEATRRLYIRDNRHGNEAEEIIDLDGPEPDWNEIQCGKNLERCSHCAWVHFPELKGTNLSTAVYLGQRDFGFHDVVAVLIGGKRYRLTGSGHRTGDVWYSAVIAGNGRRFDLPVATCEGNTYKPHLGVTWVFPPTKDNPDETFRTTELSL